MTAICLKSNSVVAIGALSDDYHKTKFSFAGFIRYVIERDERVQEEWWGRVSVTEDVTQTEDNLVWVQ